VQHLANRRGQGGLAVVDVADGADIYVRLSALEFSLRHFGPPDLSVSSSRALCPL